MNTPIKTGILGLGRSGWSMHAETLDTMPDLFEINAVCDPMPARREEAAQRFGCRTFDTMQALIAEEDIELVIVATPSQLHTPDTVRALEAGKNVLVEKPMATDVIGVDEMIAAAKKSGKILTINQNSRYMPDLARIKEVIQSGVLGRVIELRLSIHGFGRRWDWQTLRKYGGGIMNNHGAHLLDWALLFVDDPDPQLFCHMETTPLYVGDADSHTKIVLKPENGPLVDIELTQACAYPQAHCLIMGTQGSLTSDRKVVRWKYFDPAEVKPLQLDTQVLDRQYNSEELPWKEEECQIKDDTRNGLVPLYKDLYASLRQGAPVQITPESVRRQIVILQKCRELNGFA